VTSGLLWDVSEGDLARVQCLIREGADVKERDRHGRSALLLAAYANVDAGYSHVTMLQWLLEEGGSSIKETANNGWTLWNLIMICGCTCAEDYAVALSPLLKVMVMLEDTPEHFTVKIAKHNVKLAEIVTRGQQLRAQLPSYVEQQRASVIGRCPLPKVLLLLVADYATITPADMWTVGLRVGAPRAKRVREPKAKHFEEEVEEDEEVAPFLRRSQRLRQKLG
jgi:hypothetical protein